MNRLLLSTSNEFEAAIVRERLAEAGIECELKGYVARGGVTGGGAQDVYVAEEELERAKEVLEAAEGFSEQELEEMSEGGSPPAAGE